jgi:hypothetical protein
VVTLAFIPGICFAIARVLPVTPLDMFLRAWRPLAAGAVMAVVVLAVQAVAPDVPAARLAVSAGAGACTYAATTMLFWMLAGRPAGLETAIVERVWRRPGMEAT